MDSGKIRDQSLFMARAREGMEEKVGAGISENILMCRDSEWASKKN